MDFILGPDNATEYCHKIKGYTRATFALFKYHASNSYFLEHFQGLIIIHKWVTPNAFVA